MNRNTMKGAEYQTPQVTSTDIPFEGILCVSITHEAYDPNNTTDYGSSDENKGWI